MELSSYEKHQGNLNTYYYVKRANMKAIYYIIPTKWYSEKSKTIIRDSKQTNKQTKGQWLPGTKGEREIRRWGTGDF